MLDQNFPAAAHFYLIENFRVRKFTFILPKANYHSAEGGSSFGVSRLLFSRSEINYSSPLTSPKKTVIIIKNPRRYVYEVS